MNLKPGCLPAAFWHQLLLPSLQVNFRCVCLLDLSEVLSQNTHPCLSHKKYNKCIHWMYFRKDFKNSCLQIRSKPVSLRSEAAYTEFSRISLKPAENGKFSLVSLQCEKWPKHKGDLCSYKVFVVTNLYHLLEVEI